MIRALVLDFDDTILATTASRRPILDAELRRRGAGPEQIIRMHAEWGAPLRELVAPMIPAEEYPDFVAALTVLLAAQPPLACVGADALFDWAAASALPVLIVTSSESALVAHDLTTLGFVDAVERIFGFDRTAAHKPDPRVFDEAGAYLRETHAIAIGDALYLGDSLSDLACTAGVLPFAAITSGTTSREQFVAAGAADVFDDLEAFVAAR